MPKFKSQNEVDMEEKCHCSSRGYKEFCVVHNSECKFFEEDLNEGKGAFWFSTGLVIIMVVVIVSFIMKML